MTDQPTRYQEQQEQQDNEMAAALGMPVEQWREYRAWMRAMQPYRNALIASCASCQEGMRTPFLPERGDEGYTPYPESPPELVAWAEEHEREHAYDVLQEWEEPHRVRIWNMHFCDDSADINRNRDNWYEDYRRPVLWMLGSAWTAYERAHATTPAPPAFLVRRWAGKRGES